MSTWSNVITVARREFTTRVRRRSFALGTLLLVIGVVVIAFLPLIIRQVDVVATTSVAVAANEEGLAAETATALSSTLNASALMNTGAAGTGEAPDFIVTPVEDASVARQQVLDGQQAALLVVERRADGELGFVLYTEENAGGRTATMVHQAATGIAVADRLERSGVAAEDRASMFAPATFEVRWADPANAQPTQDMAAGISQDMLGFGMTILIFMIIIMYGNWVAMSVVEEKSSRVMEVILNAATPFQLLAGKVLGVGSVAFTQYAAVVAAGLVSMALTNPVTALVAGDPASLDLAQGLTPGLLLAFGAYGVLGFLLYSSMYAAAGSLVSRVEDVNAAVMPLTLVSVAAYLVAVYSATGLIDADAGWVSALAVIPFTSPFLMLGRIAIAEAAPWEIGLSLVLLVAAIVVVIWVASRIYAAGVLMYGSRTGWRTVFRLLREGM
jgi:ABC-2 type transport system permease protein